MEGVSLGWCMLVATWEGREGWRGSLVSPTATVERVPLPLTRTRLMGRYRSMVGPLLTTHTYPLLHAPTQDSGPIGNTSAFQR